jgi:hypothetical protein
MEYAAGGLFGDSKDYIQQKYSPAHLMFCDPDVYREYRCLLKGSLLSFSLQVMVRCIY